MKQVTGKGTVEEYQGKKLDTPVAYNFETSEFETIAEVKEAGKWPNDAEILSFVNKKAVTAAKAKAYQEATAALKEAYEGSTEYKRKQLIASVLAVPGKTLAEAEAIAATVFGS